MADMKTTCWVILALLGVDGILHAYGEVWAQDSAWALWFVSVLAMATVIIREKKNGP